jgi:hypothetical protein
LSKHSVPAGNICALLARFSGLGQKAFPIIVIQEDLSGAISWLTFFAGGAVDLAREAEVIGGGSSQSRRFVLSES